MARKASKLSKQQQLMRTWWVNGLLVLASLLLAYGFASLAIDSGSWLEYGITLVLIWYAYRRAVRALRLIF